MDFVGWKYISSCYLPVVENNFLHTQKTEKSSLIINMTIIVIAMSGVSTIIIIIIIIIIITITMMKTFYFFPTIIDINININISNKIKNFFNK